MAYTDRSASYALKLRLLERPHAFDFFQVVRRLDALRAASARIGATTKPADDAVRFGQVPSLAFPAATVDSYEAKGSRGAHGPADRLNVNFFGLFGANGALPLHLTEYARERERQERDPTFHRFCDIFHHRMISLFYRAWAVNQATVSFDRFAVDPDADRFGFYLACLAGRGPATLSRRDAVPDIAKRHFTGRLAQTPKAPETIAQIIADYFGVTAELIEFRGRWIDLPHACRLRLGESPTTGALGETTMVGERRWDVTQTFRVRIGPMGYAKYLRFLPGQGAFARVVGWVRNVTGYEYRWDLQLVLNRDEVPGATLGGETCMLGWTTWIKSDPEQPMDDDRGDLVLIPPDERGSAVL